jgi:hypothetical protein
MAVINPAIPSGPYSATWGTVGGNEGAVRNCGLFEGPIRWQQNAIGLPIRASQWGQTIIDYVMQGAGYFAVVVVKEWGTDSRRLCGRSDRRMACSTSRASCSAATSISSC